VQGVIGVTDGASNVISAARHAGLTHLGCSAHALNLVIQGMILSLLIMTHIYFSTEALLEVQDIIEICKQIAAYLHHSAKTAEKFKKLQKLAKPDKQGTLCTLFSIMSLIVCHSMSNTSSCGYLMEFYL
jgi:hypothetical protein